MSSDTTSSTSSEQQRRTLLQVMAASAAFNSLGLAGKAHAADAAADAQGKPGDFNFLAGEWRISHKRLRSPGVWDEFKGEATCWNVLNGVASIEELRIPARNFSGMGVRLLDVEKKLWNDYWINSTSGVLTTPGLTGVFKNGVGVFEADDEDDGKPIKVRGVWDRITSKSCRWYQTTSRDAGKSWEENWLMDWVKA